MPTPGPKFTACDACYRRKVKTRLKPVMNPILSLFRSSATVDIHVIGVSIISQIVHILEQVHENVCAEKSSEMV